MPSYRHLIAAAGSYAKKSTHVGGAIHTTSTGVGITASAITNVASATSQLWAKGRCRVDAIKTLGSGIAGNLLYIDNNGATPKLEVYILSTGVGGPYVIHLNVTSEVINLPSSSVTQAALPANGQDIIWACGWDNVGFHQRVWLFDGLGNLLASGSGNSNDGPLSSGNGFVSVNSPTGVGNTLATTLDGVAVYVGAPPADGNSAWWSKPSSGDANIQYLCYMNDAQSGTSPGTSAAQVGGVGLTWTAGQFNYTTDSTTGNWG